MEDPFFVQSSHPVTGFSYCDDTHFPFSHGNASGDFNFEPLSFADSGLGDSSAISSVIAEGDADLDDTVFSYIQQMLMEDDMGVFHDPLALQDTEKSFYDALCENDPPLVNHSMSPPHSDSSEDNCSSVVSSDVSSNCVVTSGGAGASIDSQWKNDAGGRGPSILQPHVPENFVFQSTGNHKETSTSPESQGRFVDHNRKVGSLVCELVPNIFADEESMSYFRKGMEEASKFLPKGNPLLMDVPRNATNPSPRFHTPAGPADLQNGTVQRPSLPRYGLKLKKHVREDTRVEEERSSKQSAVSPEDEIELSEMFDRVLLCAPGQRKGLQKGPSQTEALPQSVHAVRFTDGRAPSIIAGNKKGMVDLRTLLLGCAQAVSDDDQATAHHYLKQIRKHSSAFGDGSQRLAHCFANALEARMAGTGSQIYTDLTKKRTSSTETLKAYQTYLSVCPFQRFGIIFSNHMILMNVAEKARTLHIIDFGIQYGFQWPALISCLARRAGGPPKLRITGIELPQPGFRPAEGVEETGRRLAKYCERFNVPFEYHAIAQKWETIRILDLDLRPGEVVAVNCLFRFRHLFDETVVLNSPRNQVLNLVSRIRPSLFTHSIVNGNYNASFFVTRFREALFHYSTMFDAFDAKLPREDPMRLNLEKNFYGREAMNVIACEGTERVERPETYKQWQIRNVRAGFKQLPLDPVLLQKLRLKLKEYHEDFVIDVDGNWVLQGWKGRILFASSAWVPA